MAKVDATAKATKALVKTYGVSGFPTLVLLVGRQMQTSGSPAFLLFMCRNGAAQVQRQTHARGARRIRGRGVRSPASGARPSGTRRGRYENGTNTQAAPAMPRPPTAVEAWLDSTTLGHDFNNILKSARQRRRGPAARTRAAGRYEKGAAGVLFGAGVATGLVLAALLACCRGGRAAPKAKGD